MKNKDSIGTKSRSNPSEWVELHGDYLFRYAMSRLNDTSLAEDFVQETFYSALKSYDSFSGKSSERTWFTTILKNKIIDHYRKLNRRIHNETIPSDEDDPADDFLSKGFMKGAWDMSRAPGDWGEHPETVFEQQEFMDVLKTCVKQLPERIAGVFTMREIEEMESGEICKEMEISPSNLWVMLHRARSLLRRCIEHNWFLSQKKDSSR